NDAVIGDFIRFFNFRENGYALRTFYDAEENDDYFFPWQDEVLTASKIGSYTFHQTLIERSLPEQFVLELVAYAAEPGGEFVLLYTTQQPEEIIEPGQLVDTPDLDALLTEECFESNGLRSFCLDKGAYRIRVDYHKNIAREDLAALIELL
ncbi:MAG: hypothetical protein IKN55_08755, partial [Oscillospiraceae bacterium]|nr:hypothetical protein [Oscillospiraceae bacterium]